MKVARRALTGTLTALAIAVAGPALSAHSAGYRFQTISSISGGKVQACRIPSAASKPYVVKLRVDARRATARLNGSGMATNRGTQVGRAWHSGWVNKGQVS